MCFLHLRKSKSFITVLKIYIDVVFDKHFFSPAKLLSFLEVNSSNYLVLNNQICEIHSER